MISILATILFIAVVWLLIVIMNRVIDNFFEDFWK